MVVAHYLTTLNLNKKEEQHEHNSQGHKQLRQQSRVSRV